MKSLIGFAGVAARWLWLIRLGAVREEPRELFPQGVSLSDLPTQWEEMHSRWTQYFEDLMEAHLERIFEYHSLEGPWFRNSIEDILTQLFGHSSYHRGQIAARLRSIGAQPAMTDFVFWCREAVSPPAKS